MLAAALRRLLAALARAHACAAPAHLFLCAAAGNLRASCAGERTGGGRSSLPLSPSPGWILFVLPGSVFCLQHAASPGRGGDERGLPVSLCLPTPPHYLPLFFCPSHTLYHWRWDCNRHSFSPALLRMSACARQRPFTAQADRRRMRMPRCVQRRSRAATRDVRTCCAVSRAPIFTHLLPSTSTPALSLYTTACSTRFLLRETRDFCGRLPGFERRLPNIPPRRRGARLPLHGTLSHSWRLRRRLAVERQLGVAWRADRTTPGGSGGVPPYLVYQTSSASLSHSGTGRRFVVSSV